MPAPIAKGILVTVSVLVAAGVAVYNSPQFQEWMSNSRRKLAVALHNLGDEIQPRDSQGEDISMNEEVGEAAEERRRIARAEIMRRAALLESLSRARDSSQPLDSFDSLVDQDGNLLLPQDVQRQFDGDTTAKSTAIDTGAHQPSRRGINPDISDDASIGKSGDLLDISSDTMSHHPSESEFQFTPTSEAPAEMLFDPFSGTPVRAQSPVSASSKTEDHADYPDYFYGRPNSALNDTQQQTLVSGLDEPIQANQFQHELSTASSVAGSSVHVHEAGDTASDGDMSDFGVMSMGIATPASWSEVGSVISENDAGHHQ